MKGSTLATGADARPTGTGEEQHDFGGLSPDDLLSAYRLMLLSRKIDDKEIQLKNQSHAYFQISGAGHEAILVAAGKNLRAGYDWFFPYYRDRALCLALGYTPREMFLASVGSKDDPASAGRQMPSHWSHRALNIPSQSSATGTQCLHAVGCAEASLLYERVKDLPDAETASHLDEVTYVSIGDGATSEGEFWEALNTACNRHVPVLFLVEDNGYAISVPVEVQTPGGDISAIVEHIPGLTVWRCDGTDYIASHAAMRSAVTHVRERKGPALVHAKVIRPYSHSLSDDEKLYKTTAERQAEAKRDPIVRLRHLILGSGLATEDALHDLGTAVEREVNQAAEEALAAAKPDPETATLYVFSPDVDPTSEQFATDADPSGFAGNDGRRDQPDAQGRDGAEHADRRVRRRRRGCQPGRDPRPRGRQRRRVQGHARPAAALRQLSVSSIRRSPRPTSSDEPSAWRCEASNRWSRFSSSTTSGLRSCSFATRWR